MSIVLLSGCASSKISIDILKLPDSPLSQPVRNVVLMNRVDINSSKTKQFVQGRVVAQYNSITDIMVNETISEMESIFNSNQYFNVFDTSFTFIPKNGSYGSSPLPIRFVSQMCQSVNADALVVIEGYNAEVDTDSDVLFSTPVERTYGTVRVPYFNGEQSVYMQMLFRAYTCKNGEGKVDLESDVSTQVSVSASGSTPYEVNNRIADANNVLIQAARKLASDYTEQIAPKWETKSRKIYSTGTEQMKQAYIYAKGGNWSGASDIWYLLATSNNTKLASRATFNLIVASEISGDIDLALEWANLCVDKYKMDQVKSYIAELEERKKEITKMEFLFPELKM
ncbi:hypothetical protein KFE94_13430 [bacterium SCSIO 12643]|nr:hypothetical protein KFE94_13430 [bacterium SCSIO 12643]